MSTFSRLIKFVASEDNKTYFADAGASGAIEASNKYDGYPSIEAFNSKSGGKKVTASQVGLFTNRLTDRQLTPMQLLSPAPTTSNPIYCVGLNYAPHVKESGVFNF
jgi:2-keto-4-pentenoate hydratase/2-oxohepta-3-ene-1,7-dioic acid hydratase in catechol pathway